MSHVTHINEPRQICAWVTSRINESRHMKIAPCHSCRSQFYLHCVAWLIHVWRASFICVTWLIHTCYVSLAIIFRSVFHRSICIAWRDSFMCDVTHAYIWRGSWISMSWLIHMCGSCRTTASFVPHVWTSHSAHADMIHLYDLSTYDSSTYDSPSAHVDESFRCMMNHVMHLNAPCHTHQHQWGDYSIFIVSRDSNFSEMTPLECDMAQKRMCKKTAGQCDMAQKEMRQK